MPGSALGAWQMMMNTVGAPPHPRPRDLVAQCRLRAESNNHASAKCNAGKVQVSPERERAVDGCQDGASIALPGEVTVGVQPSKLGKVNNDTFRAWSQKRRGECLFVC